MRVAITATGCGPESTVDSRFLAARFVVIFDSESRRWDCERVSLWARNKKRCGKMLVGLLESAGVDTLISGAIDPLSFKKLCRSGIRIYEAPESLAREAAEMLAAERLRALPLPDAIDVSRLPGKGTPSEI